MSKRLRKKVGRSEEESKKCKGFRMKGNENLKRLVPFIITV
jgi:hypothetical protein